MTTEEGIEIEDCGMVDRTMTVVGWKDELTPGRIETRKKGKAGGPFSLKTGRWRQMARNPAGGPSSRPGPRLVALSR